MSNVSLSVRWSYQQMAMWWRLGEWRRQWFISLSQTNYNSIFIRIRTHHTRISEFMYSSTTDNGIGFLLEQMWWERINRFFFSIILLILKFQSLKNCITGKLIRINCNITAPHLHIECTPPRLDNNSNGTKYMCKSNMLVFIAACRAH